MKIILAGLLALCAFDVAAASAPKTASADAASTNSVTAAAKMVLPVISNVWISEAPPVAKNNAAFFTVKNAGQKDVLLSVATPASASAEMHEMSMAGGMMRMRQLPQIKLVPNAELKFSPGGRHVMLINMKQPLKVGDKVPLTLKFRKAGIITVEAEVRRLDVTAADMHD
jgi:copper(I)-binding protein